LNTFIFLNLQINGTTPLIIATKNNNFEIVDMLLKVKNIDLNMKDNVSVNNT
jgi:ankyrin repeat protein